MTVAPLVAVVYRQVKEEVALMVQDCPRCRLVNPPTAQRCDCGYDFAARAVRPSYLPGAASASLAHPSLGELALCVLAAPVGLLLGAQTRRRGRPEAGRVMVLVSCVTLGVTVGGYALVALMVFLSNAD